MKFLISAQTHEPLLVVRHELPNVAPEQQMLTVYVEPLPNGVDEKYRNVIHDAIDYWENHKKVKFEIVSSSSEAKIYVSWAKEFGGLHAGRSAPRQGLVEIGLGDSTCLRKWQIYSYKSILRIAAHELGHCLGYGDDQLNPNRVMYYKIAPHYNVNVDETEILSARWSRFYPICAREDGVYSIEIKSTKPINVQVVPSEQSFELYKVKQPFQDYAECRASDVQTYSHNCSISGNDAGIIIAQSSNMQQENEGAQFTLTVNNVSEEKSLSDLTP